MFFPVARMRRIASALLLLAPFAFSREESLFTSSVTYCAPPETLLIQQFDVAYIAKNTSIIFNISAASVEPNINVTANLLLNVYGMHPFNFTIDLCSIFNGALCPLPMYNFTGSSSLPVPSSLGVSNKIPGIAFKIPDLEAFAQLTLTQVGTSNVKACVQSTLSNGWSTHQPAVEWSIGGFALLALLSAMWQSLSPEALAPYRLLDLLYLYQSIAASGFLNLNYPSVYRAFTLNFAWAMGLFPASASSSLQSSINRMRHLTGGDMADAVGSAVGLVNRKLSPYNVPLVTSGFALPQSLLGQPANFPSHLSNFATANPSARLGNLTQLATGDVATVTEASSNILQAGVPIYVNSIRIATANAFITVFISALILAAIALGVFGLGYGGLIAIERFGRGKHERFAEFRYTYPSLVRAWSLRLSLVAFTPIIIFTFYQWTLKDSWLSILLSVLLLLFIIGYVFYPIYLTMRLALRSTPHSLYSQPEHLASHGPLYAQYRTPRYYFFLPLLVASFLKALFIAFAKGNGEVQIVFMIIIELFVFLAYVTLRPYKTKGGDVLATFLAVVRLVATGLMVAFLERLGLAAIPRVIIGIIIAVLFSVAVIVMLVNIVLHGLQRLWSLKPSRPASPQGSADEAMLERGETTPPASESRFGRPINPTPEHNVRLDTHINHPYPLTTPTPTTVEQSSEYSRDSASTTFGSLMPRRWSFSHSPPMTSSHTPNSSLHWQNDLVTPRQSDSPSSPPPHTR